MKPPTISLIIPAHNEEHYIEDCLKYALENSKGKFHEIIVVDNASTDRTSEIARKMGVRVVYESKKGLTCARQRGLEEATGELLAYTDADTRIPPDWIEKVEAFYTGPEAQERVCLSGPYHYYDGVKWKNFIMTILWYISAPITYRIVGYMVLGGNFVARRDALIKMGGFDKSIDFYGEDTDIARRLSTFGKVVFKMNFYIDSSLRRLSTEGMFKVNFVYGMNFIWQVVFHRPFTKKSKDIRIQVKTIAKTTGETKAKTAAKTHE